jgi:predicted permease
VLEIALSIVLLVGAGLLVRSFVALQRMPLAFEPRGLVAVDVMLHPGLRVEQRVARRNEIVGRLRAMPGVTEASIGMMPGLGWRALATLEAEPDASGRARSVPEFSVTFITPNYFRVAGMRLVAGRLPDSLAPVTAGSGPPGAPQEIVVNRALARRFWPDGRVIGARLAEKGGPPGLGESYTVVGVVDDIQMPGRRSATAPEAIYRPLPPRLSDIPVLLRTTLRERDVVASIRRLVADFNRTIGGELGAVVRSVTMGETYLRESLAPTRFAMALLAAFSTVALVLSGVGLYGVIAYSVSQRTREIGVRVALGAEPRAVTGLVMGSALRLALAGVAIGAAAAAASTRVLESMLYGVSASDPATFAAIALLVGAIALVAAWVPARRALRVDPTEALRAE